MSDSQVDASPINTNFPVAGQSNPSQGFRDNFSFIKTALQRTGVELSELRNLAITKAAIPGDQLTNDVNYNKIFRAQLQSFSQSFNDIGTTGLSTVIDFNNGNFQKITTSGTLEITLANFPKSGQIGSLKLWVTTTGSNHSIRLPESVKYGIKADYIQSGYIVFPDMGQYLIEFTSVDNGDSYWITAIHGLEEFATIQGSGAGYELPIAGTTEGGRLGGVRVDGNTIAINAGNGVISVIGALPAPSDQRLKTNVETIADPVSKLLQLRGVNYTEISTGKHRMGVIAQEVEQVIPEVVDAMADGHQGVHYGNMAGLFIETIKQLHDQIQQLKEQIAEFKNS